jgi:hypothetical protein
MEWAKQTINRQKPSHAKRLQYELLLKLVKFAFIVLALLYQKTERWEDHYFNHFEWQRQRRYPASLSTPSL